jgi:diguanylate cyclase (GGDEF)-like protein
LARYGGEEFMIVMPHTELVGASIIAERLRALVEEKMAITVSGGVTEARDEDTQESLIARADIGLYAAKSGGRNLLYHSAGNHTEAVSSEAVLAE